MNGIHEVGGSIPPGSTTPLRRPLAAWAAVVAALLSISPAFAQEAAPSCDGRAALYDDGRSLKLWVTRGGTLLEEDPLRPLTPKALVVLEVIVNGRLASAVGPDAARLRQAAAPDKLAGAEPIRWRPAGSGLPPALRIVAEDGRALFENVRFVECGDAPKTASAPSAPAGAARPARPDAAAPARRDPAPAEAGRSGVRLPQGALSDGVLR